MYARIFRVAGAFIFLVAFVALVWRQIVWPHGGRSMEDLYGGEALMRLSYAMSYLFAAAGGLLVFAAGLVVEHLGIGARRAGTALAPEETSVVD